MRISDWSSDVCASDLRTSPAPDARHAADVPAIGRLPVHRALATCSHNPARRLPAAGQRPPHPMPAASDPCASGQTQSWPPADQQLMRQRRALQMRRSEEHTSELQSLMRISYAVFCLKKKTITQRTTGKAHSRTKATQTQHQITHARDSKT